MKRIFSGVKPSGELTIGNYLGAIQNWVKIYEQYESIFCIVDLHAITVSHNPKELYERTYKILAIYLASGLDPKKATFFVQSHIPAHTELSWIINCHTYMGELGRMTQFKDKSQKNMADKSSVGLFDYPVLMASDILLYQTDIVPVGEDQVQHVEFTRDIAKRFNNKYGQLFKIPQVLLRENGARIMALDDPHKKMEKTADSQYNYILILDKPEIIQKKISRAVTDSEKTIDFDPKRAGLYNLMIIYSLFSGLTSQEIEKKYIGKGYKEFKKDLANLIIENLVPIQNKYHKFINDKNLLDKILAEGTKKAQTIAQKTLSKVKNKVGFIKTIN
jgi:tryptophanyl-tRNA synthetase